MEESVLKQLERRLQSHGYRLLGENQSPYDFVDFIPRQITETNRPAEIAAIAYRVHDNKSMTTRTLCSFNVYVLDSGTPVDMDKILDCYHLHGSTTPKAMTVRNIVLDTGITDFNYERLDIAGLNDSDRRNLEDRRPEVIRIIREDDESGNYEVNVIYKNAYRMDVEELEAKLLGN